LPCWSLDSKTGFVLLRTHQLKIPKESVCILVKYIHTSRWYYEVVIFENFYFIKKILTYEKFLGIFQTDNYMNFCHNETIAYKRWRSSHYGKNSHSYQFENYREISHHSTMFYCSMYFWNFYHKTVCIYILRSFLHSLILIIVIHFIVLCIKLGFLKKISKITTVKSTHNFWTTCHRTTIKAYSDRKISTL